MMSLDDLMSRDTSRTFMRSGDFGKVLAVTRRDETEPAGEWTAVPGTGTADASQQMGGGENSDELIWEGSTTAITDLLGRLPARGDRLESTATGYAGAYVVESAEADGQTCRARCRKADALTYGGRESVEVR